MSIRSIFISKPIYPFFEEIHVTFDWFGGLALSQKRKCEIGLHKNFNRAYPEHKALEISSASLNPIGNKLSAMNLIITTKRGQTSVESAFQSSRIYFDGDEKIGPFPEYLFSPGKEAKKSVKEASRGLHSYQYEYDNMKFYAPDFHISLFYDYLYLNALLEDHNKSLADEILKGEYNAFSDLATSSLNSQARSCAIFVGLSESGLTEDVKTFESYLKLFRCTYDGKAVDSTSYDHVQLLDKKSGKVRLYSPVVPCVFGKEETEMYYKKFYSHLSNKKTPDGYTRLGIYDIDLSHIEFAGIYLNEELKYIRVIGVNGCINIPTEFFDDIPEACFWNKISLVKQKDLMLTEDEIKNHVIWPFMNSLHTDILTKIRKTSIGSVYGGYMT